MQSVECRCNEVSVREAYAADIRYNHYLGWIELEFLSVSVIIILVLLGAFIGLISSFISFLRFSSI